MTGHAEFEELCTVWSTGSLTDEQRVRLLNHLPGCITCQKYMDQFERIANAAMATVAPDYASRVTPTERSWDQKGAKRKLFERLPGDDNCRGTRGDEGESSGADLGMRSGDLRGGNQRQISLPRLQWLLPYAAGFLLACGLGTIFYWNGPRMVLSSFRLHATQAERDASSLRQGVNELSKERDTLNSQLKEETGARTNLGVRIEQQRQQMEKLQTAALKAEEEKRRLEAAQEKLNGNLQETQSALASVRDELDSARREHANEALKTAALEKRVEEDSALRKELDRTIEQQREMLASDRDIRDLMGARELLVTDVYDVGEDGKDRKPFARAFFTKDKSLIFYGFDLDKQPEVTNANSFQVWGDRGSFRNGALNLGILYQDVSANKRWILKIEDPKTLQQIRAVFVTIEPKGGSREPTGKALLFAYLRVQPNHP